MMATTARIGNRKTWIVNVGAYNGGTHDHSKLFNRDANDQHPMGAIKGLETFEKNTKAHMASKENPHGVTADQVGARPDTWMPTAAEVGAAPNGLSSAYVTASTEDEITARLSEVYASTADNTVKIFCLSITSDGLSLAGGSWFVTIYRSWNQYGYAEAVCYGNTGGQKFINSMWGGSWIGWKNASQSAFAPAGYGLGEDFPREATDIESIAKSGFVRWYNNTITAIPYGWYYGMYIDYGTDDGLLLLKQYNSANMVLRHRGNDGWNAWEWVNPPLSLGVVYRTTERWNGKVVYARMIDFGLLPNNQPKSMRVDDGITDLVRVDGDIEGTLVSLATAPCIKEISIINGNSLQIITNTDASAMYTSPTVYYCKG